MPLIAILSILALIGGFVYLTHPRPEIRRWAKGGIVAGSFGATLIVAAFAGPILAVVLAVLLIALSFLTKFWS
ncbi:MAG: hypothetical protein AAF646_16355 [Pseudomonadota bacterium]